MFVLQFSDSQVLSKYKTQKEGVKIQIIIYFLNIYSTNVKLQNNQKCESLFSLPLQFSTDT